MSKELSRRKEGVMNRSIRESVRCPHPEIRVSWVAICACVSVELCPAGIAAADAPQGAVVGWGGQVVGVDMSGPYLAVAAGGGHSLGLKADGSIVAWGDNGAVPTR